MYYKITNKKENHNGFQYKDGLNELLEQFNDNPNASCCKGGFYFTDINHILNFTHLGRYIREVFLPTDDPSFKIIKDLTGDKWRANKIILGERHYLWDIETFKWLKERGINKEKFSTILYKVCNEDHHEIVKFLMKEYLDLNSKECKDLLHYACQYDHYEIVKFLVENYENCIDDIHNCDALRIACTCNNTKIVKYLISREANIVIKQDDSVLYYVVLYKVIMLRLLNLY